MPNLWFMAAWKAVVVVLLALLAFGADEAHASTSKMGWKVAPDYVTAIPKGGVVNLPRCTTEVDVRAVGSPTKRVHQDYLGAVTEQGDAYGWQSKDNKVNTVWLTAWNEVYSYGRRTAIVAAWCS